MKPHERRRVGAYPYYMLSTWNERLQCYVSGKKTYSTIQQARVAAKKKGKYSITEITESGRKQIKTFLIGEERLE